MKKVLLMAVALLASVTTYAQGEVGKITLKPTVGLSIANMSKSDGNFKVGFVGGVEFEAPVSEQFSVQFGALYSMQGAKASSGEAASMGVDAVSINTGYINVPVLLNAYVTKGLAFKIGLQPGILVSATAKASSGSSSASEDMKSMMNTFDLSVPIGVSYEYKNVVLDGRYNFGVLKTLKGSGEGSLNQVIQITLGYKFSL